MAKKAPVDGKAKTPTSRKVGQGCLGIFLLTLAAIFVSVLVAPRENRAQSSNAGVAASTEPAPTHSAPSEVGISKADAAEHVRKVIALYDELRRCTKNPVFATTGFAPPTTPCRGWMDRVKALQADDGLAASGGFDCLAGDLAAMGLSLLEPKKAESRDHIAFVSTNIATCRTQLKALAAQRAPMPKAMADADNEKTITRATWSHEWIFTTDTVKLRCAESTGPHQGKVTVVVGDQEYALNGNAKTSYPDMFPVWRTNPAIPGTRIPITDEIKTALSLCK